MKATGNNAYDEQVARLHDYLHENELQRRVWAEEKWQHPEGYWFRIARIAAPVLSLYTIISLILYCLIRDAQLIIELAYQADTRNVGLYMGLMLMMCVVLLGSAVLLFLKKYVAGALAGAAAVLTAGVHIATQLNIPMPHDQYRIYFTVNLVIYAALLACFAAIVGILWYDRIEQRRMVQNTLYRLAGRRGGARELLTLDDYAALIDEFLAEEAHKRLSQQSVKAKKRKNRK